MYCINCGNKMDNSDNYCIRCGNKVSIDNNSINKNDYSGKKISSIILGAVSIVLSMLVIFAPLGLIISIIGSIISFLALKNEKNVLGLVLNIIGFVISFFICILFILVIRYVVTDMDTNWLNDFEYRDNFGFDDHSGRF